MGLDGGTIISRNDVLRGSCWDLNKADNSRSSRGGSVSGIYKRRKLDTRTSRWVKVGTPGAVLCGSGCMLDVCLGCWVACLVKPVHNTPPPSTEPHRPPPLPLSTSSG
jgi:hypothetical protein